MKLIFMSNDEINQKYPIQNKKWKYSFSTAHGPPHGRAEHYYSYYKDWGTEKVSDPWFREIKNIKPIETNKWETVFSTTVEGNQVILVIYHKKYDMFDLI